MKMKNHILIFFAFIMFSLQGFSMVQHSNSIEIDQLIHAWQKFLSNHTWQELTQNVDPIHGGCGPVYELPNYLNRENENLAIVDMRNIKVAEPHYHPHENIEVYFVLQGTARVIVGRNERFVQVGDVVIIPPNKAHFTFPDENYVIACVNTPPYKPENYIPLYETNEAVEFDREYFESMQG